MGGFFYRTEEEVRRLNAITRELGRVGSRISKYDSTKGDYSVPKSFDTSWIFYRISEGVASEEKMMREEYTTIQVLERLLMMNIKTLKEMESMPKTKHG